MGSSTSPCFDYISDVTLTKAYLRQSILRSLIYVTVHIRTNNLIRLEFQKKIQTEKIKLLLHLMLYFSCEELPFRERIDMKRPMLSKVAFIGRLSQPHCGHTTNLTLTKSLRERWNLILELIDIVETGSGLLLDLCEDLVSTRYVWLTGRISSVTLYENFETNSKTNKLWECNMKIIHLTTEKSYLRSVIIVKDNETVTKRYRTQITRHRRLKLNKFRYNKLISKKNYTDYLPWYDRQNVMFVDFSLASRLSIIMLFPLHFTS